MIARFQGHALIAESIIGSECAKMEIILEYIWQHGESGGVLFFFH